MAAKLPPSEKGVLFVSAFTNTGASDESMRRGVVLRIMDEDRRMVMEAEISFEAFGSTVTRHDEQPLTFRCWRKGD